MRKQSEIESELEHIEERLDDKEGHDLSHAIGYRNAIEWVLNND